MLLTLLKDFYFGQKTICISPIDKIGPDQPLGISNHQRGEKCFLKFEMKNLIKIHKKLEIFTQKK